MNYLYTHSGNRSGTGTTTMRNNNITGMHVYIWV